MQDLKITDNQLNSIANYTKPTTKIIFSEDDVDLFDQNGYDLSRIEQFYCDYNDLKYKDHRVFRQAIKRDWFTQTRVFEGAHLNHALIFERKGFSGDAYDELRGWCDKYPTFFKVLKIKSKWGLDFSVDYCDREGNVFEVFHWEYDGFDYNEIVDMKLSHEEKFMAIDWDDAAKTLLNKKDEWYHLDFFAQSHYKSNYFGIADERFKLVILE